MTLISDETILKIATLAAEDVQGQYPKVDYLLHTVRAAVIKAASDVVIAERREEKPEEIIP